MTHHDKMTAAIAEVAMLAERAEREYRLLSGLPVPSMRDHVTPAERDKYVFLETLLCARERFVVSWVARDELDGLQIHPSMRLRIDHYFEGREQPYLG